MKRFIRPGATGSCNGTDWANAYPAIPQSLTRGAIYYLAAGDYPTQVLNDAQSGKTDIEIVQATDADHGTNVGWSSHYASPQPIRFIGGLHFVTGYYRLRGDFLIVPHHQNK